MTVSLRIENVSVSYGAIRALRDVTLNVGEGEIVTLIGANGAGKTTTLMAVSGLVHPAEGRIVLNGQDITRLAPDRIVRLGVCHVPEGRRIFGELTVQENLELGAFTLTSRRAIRENMDTVLGTFPRLGERLRQYAGTLSGGEQQMLAIGRALMSHPRLLLLDEPSLGLAPVLVQEIFHIIRRINQQGTGILLVEQNAHMALGVAARGYVLESGRLALSGSAQDLLNSPDVRRAYLGE